MPLNAQVAVSVVAHETAVGDLSRTVRVTPATYAMLFTDGTAANQAQVVWSKTGTAGNIGTADFVMNALPDTRDGAAVTVAFTTVKAVYVRNTSTSGTLNIGLAGIGPAFPGFPAAVGALPIGPGGVYCVVSPGDSGFAATLTVDNVTSGLTARLTAGSGSPTYEVMFIGEGTVT
jgi:hypothetical protein